MRYTAAAVLFSALVLHLPASVAQSTTTGASGSTKPANPSGATARPSPSRAAPPTTHSTAKPGTHTTQQRRAHVPAPITPAQRAALPAADDVQKAAADLVYYGKYICDQKYEIHVERSAESPGYVDVRYQKDVWVMKPVASNTGAVRLEDMQLQTLLVQIPSKSMLLNTRTGQRLVDSCVGEGHLQAQKAAELAAATEAAAATAAQAPTTPSSGPSQTGGATDPSAVRKPD